MPPAFILSQDQTLHCKKFDRLLRGASFWFYCLTQYQGASRLDSGNLTLISHLHCAVQFPRSIPVLGATRHYFTPDFVFCKSFGRFFMENRAFFADFAPVAARRGRGIPHGEAMCARARTRRLCTVRVRAFRAHMDATGSAAPAHTVTQKSCGVGCLVRQNSHSAWLRGGDARHL